ncbi:FixH family protein [Caldalkalibacillus salinus]|uniref:FixH family protein n=1 Tax=Caldalkalibacillus salinus TaxID=2803787 RepID=UPI0019248145|nr:FixH family protein [Caldalkalibacillus salinus]
MKIYNTCLLGLILVLLLSACVSGESVDDQTVHLLQVDLEYEPENIEPQENVILAVHILQGDEPVDDALVVQFEVLQEGEDPLFLTAELEDNGRYTAQVSFDEEGIYHVMAHVTARDMHVMPHDVIPVGSFTHNEIEEAKRSKPGSRYDHGYLNENQSDEAQTDEANR